MKQRKRMPFMITGIEAITTSKHATSEELNFCYDLYKEYVADPETRLRPNNLFDFIRMLTLFYHAGRLQGIREERAKNKSPL